MPKTFCLLNHKLTQNQLTELKEKYNSSEIIYPPQNIASGWAQIPPNETDGGIVQSVVDWLKENNSSTGDFFIIQGEFGATFTLVDYALKKELNPLYATTRRISKESCVGETVHREYVFEHFCFKKYQYY